MALIFVEGFEQYSNSAASDLSTPNRQNGTAMPCAWVLAHSSVTFSAVFSNTLQPVGTTGRSLSLAYGNTSFASVAFPPSGLASVFLGFAYRQSSLVSSQVITLSATSGYTSTTGLGLKVNADGSVSAFNLSTSSSYCSTSANLVAAGTWQYFELKVVFGAAGSVEIFCDGTSVGTASGIDTRGGVAGAAYTYVNFVGPPGVANTYVDDIYICDNSSAVNNDVLGPVKVYTTFPTAAGSSTQFTPVGSASNFSCVQKQIWDGAFYAKTTSAAVVDNFSIAALPSTPASIVAVIVGNRSKKNDTGKRYVRNLVTVGAQTALGVQSAPLSGAYRDSQDIFLVQPDGSSAWTGAAVNSMLIGIKSA